MVNLVQDKVTIELRLWPRYELETPFGEPVVAGRGLMATGTDGFRTRAGSRDDLNALTIGTETDLTINESGETVATI